MVAGSSGEPELFQCAVICHVYYHSHSGPRTDRVVQCADWTLQAGRLPSAEEDGYVMHLRMTIGSGSFCQLTNLHNNFCSLVHLL